MGAGRLAKFERLYIVSRVYIYKGGPIFDI